MRQHSDQGHHCPGSPEEANDQTALLVSLTSDDTPYLCPGESLPINRAVHLARLRSHYQKCKTCPHRMEAEHFSADAHQQLEEWWNYQEKSPDRLQDGFGSQSPNEFSVQSGAVLAQAFANMRWEQKIGQVSLDRNNERQTISDVRPTIVMGHDLSETSLEMMRESVRSVREQGCHIIDVGGVTPACMKFILEHLQADAGIHATSRRKDGSGAGLDLYGSQAMPLSSESLYEVQARLHQNQLTRYSRSDGGLTPFPARKAYLDSLWKYFQNIRPVRIWLNTTNELVIDSLQELFHNIPGQLIISQEQYSFNPAEKLDIKRLHPLQSHFMDEDCELGIILDSQGQACHFLDENFREIPSAKILSLLYEQIKRNNATDPNNIPLVMLGEELRADGITWDSATEDIFRYRQSLREYFTRGITTAKTSLGYDALHRYWFVDESPVCDGIITLGKVLQAISGEPGILQASRGLTPPARLAEIFADFSKALGRMI